MNTAEMKEMAEKTAASVRSKHAKLRQVRIKNFLSDWDQMINGYKTNDWPASDRPMDDDIYD